MYISEMLDEVVNMGIFINPLLLYEMTPLEITLSMKGYIAKEKRESRQDNIRAGIIAAAIYEVNRNPKKRHKPYTWRDIISDEDHEKKQGKTAEQIKNVCKSICKALGGKINVA